MLPFEDRYSRQRKLPEVGPQGQRALANASLRVSPRVTGSEVFELCYLQRAGVARVTVSDAHVQLPSPHAQAFQFTAPRTLAVGALGALAQLRQTLGLTEQSS